ncbi:glycine--tRNA ligase [Candidatus Woesearchaeota archaeon]|nr:glycine--tRNA ligase [Candidatus Woesearchaeota archaeon]
MTTITIEDLTIFCKKKGIVYQDSAIYGGMSGFWDFGPYGVELMNNIKTSFWKHFVHDKENMVGMEGSIISHPRVWKASGHVDNFGDLLLMCTKCRHKVRADHFLAEKLQMVADGLKSNEINDLIRKHQLHCPECKGTFAEAKDFNLLFATQVGAEESKTSTAYLRGETAQAMFTNFKLIAETTRQRLPFGILQIGKCFRNEIAPRDFMFRSREFTIGEFEFFIHPEEKTCNLLTPEHRSLKVHLLDKETQDKGKETLQETTIGQMLKEHRLDEWHAYWLSEQLMWLHGLGLSFAHLKVREHMKSELSHYSSATFDIDYSFPFGSKEIAGNANRGQYDLTQHMKESKEQLTFFDEEKKQHVVPRIIEPTFGMERVFLAVLCETYHDDKERGNIMLKLHPKIAPMKIGVFPLVNKLDEEARRVFALLSKEFLCFYDKSGSIGRRYARADELGIPFCVTVDFETLEKKEVTIRDRNTTKQVKVSVDKLKSVLALGLLGEDVLGMGKSV